MIQWRNNGWKKSKLGNWSG